MIISELVERLNEFDPDSEVSICNGISISWSDVRIGRSPNTINIGCGIGDIGMIIDTLIDSSYEIRKTVKDLEESEDTENIENINKSLDNIDRVTNDLYSLWS